jgi:lysozyme
MANLTRITQKPNLAFKTLVKTALQIYDQPDPALVLGIDTSHWTGIVDWQAAKAGGIRFAIVKALDGIDAVRYSEENYRGAKDAGILIGAYSWLRKAVEVSNGGQARAYLAWLKDHPCDIRPAVDFEWSPAGKKFNVDTGDLWGFSQPFESGYGKKPMIYTAPGYWSQFGTTDPKWAEYPLWQAQYAKQPQIMPPWAGWKFWQFTATGDGSKYGVPATGEKAVDLSYWCGTLEELNKWCGINIPIPAPLPVPVPVPGIDYEQLYNTVAKQLNNANYIIHQIESLVNNYKEEV